MVSLAHTHARQSLDGDVEGIWAGEGVSVCRVYHKYQQTSPESAPSRRIKIPSPQLHALGQADSTPFTRQTCTRATGGSARVE